MKKKPKKLVLDKYIYEYPALAKFLKRQKRKHPKWFKEWNVE